jgi:hypothetical protein
MNTRAIGAAGRALLEKEPRTGAELGRLLHERWPDRDARTLAYAVQYLEPLVQVPPRGVWGASGQATWTTVEAWLGRRLTAKPSPERMVTRYLAAFGPATVRDMQVWSGVTGMREVAERLRPRLRAFRNEHGLELFDLPDAPRPDPDSPAPPCFLPYFENALLSYADRARFIGDGPRGQAFTSAGLLVGTALIDGFVGARWKVVRAGAKPILTIEPFARLRKQDRAALADEGDRLLAIVAADSPNHDIRFGAPLVEPGLLHQRRGEDQRHVLLRKSVERRWLVDAINGLRRRQLQAQGLAGDRSDPLRSVSVRRPNMVAWPRQALCRE